MGKGSILIVDDEPGIRDLLTQILGDEGFETTAVASGEQALTHMDQELFDLVLLDLWLPGIDGFEVLDQLRSSHAVPVIVISGHASAEQAVAAVHRGAHDFLEKPLSYDRVVVSINNTLRQSRLERRVAEATADEKPVSSLTGSSPVVQQLRREIELAAESAGRVLVKGPNGSGKEVVARMLHRLSPRSAAPFIAVNCAAIPSELIESELFGHLKGAFTGAVESKRGKFELADGGTLFLDEVGDMSLLTQAKVLRVLQEQRFNRLGGSKEVTVDVRVVAATNKDLEAEIAEGRFRQDLFFRLNVVPIRVPALAERLDDIPGLVHQFSHEIGETTGIPAKRFSPEALQALQAYGWPGNIRELRNVVERLMIMVADNEIGEPHLRFLRTTRRDALDDVPGDEAGLLPLRDARARFERRYIGSALERCGGNVTRTAELLGVERSHLHRKMRQLDLGER